MLRLLPEAGTGQPPSRAQSRCPETARRMKAGGGGAPGAGTLCPTLLRMLFWDLIPPVGDLAASGSGAAHHGQAGRSRGCEPWPRGGGVIWGTLKQWPSLLFPREGEVLGGLDAARLAGLEGFSGPLAAFLLLAQHPLNPLGGVSGDSAAQEPGTRKRVLRKVWGRLRTQPPPRRPGRPHVGLVMPVSCCRLCFSPLLFKNR